MSTPALSTNYNVLDQASKMVNGLSDTSTPKTPPVIKQANEILETTVKKTGKEVYNQTIKGIDKSFLKMLYGADNYKTDEEKKSIELQENIKKTALINESRKKLAQITGQPPTEAPNKESQKEAEKIRKQYSEMKHEHHTEQNAASDRNLNTQKRDEQEKQKAKAQEEEMEKQKKQQKKEKMNARIAAPAKSSGSRMMRKPKMEDQIESAPPQKTAERRAGQGIGG